MRRDDEPCSTLSRKTIIFIRIAYITWCCRLSNSVLCPAVPTIFGFGEEQPQRNRNHWPKRIIIMYEKLKNLREQVLMIQMLCRRMKQHYVRVMQKIAVRRSGLKNGFPSRVAISKLFVLKSDFRQFMLEISTWQPKDCSAR